MTLLRTALIACFATFATCVAADTAPDGSKGRFTMSPVDGGLMRLDTETGAVALCTKKSETWVCEPIDDHSGASGDKAKLEMENKALKDRIKDLETSAAAAKSAPGSDDQSGPPGGVTKLPTEQEVDKAMDYVERIYKKFKDRIQKLDQPPAKPAPKIGEDGKGAL